MNAVFEPLAELESFNRLRESIENKKTPVLATGVIDAQKCHMIAGLMDATGRPVMVVSHSELSAKKILGDLGFFLQCLEDGKGKPLRYYPSKDVSFYAADLRSADIEKERMGIIRDVVSGLKPSIVLSSEALTDKLASKPEMAESVITIKPGTELALGSLAERLVRMGYERVELAEAPGHFAVRGGIADIYTPVYEYALRVEFYGDEIDSVRFLDTLTQRSVENLKEAAIYPMTGSLGEASSSLLSYLGSEYVVFFDEPARVSKHMETLRLEFEENVKNHILKGGDGSAGAQDTYGSYIDSVFTYEDVLAHASAFDTVLMVSITQAVKDFRVRAICDFAVKPAHFTRGKPEEFAGEINFWCDNGYRVLLLTGTGYQAGLLADEILHAGRTASYAENISNAALHRGVVTIARGGLSGGFEYPGVKYAVASDASAVAQEKKRRRHSRQKASKIDVFTDLKAGDYIVHDSHGVGIYRGIEQIVIDHVSRDYLKLSYADGGNIYVATDQMEHIQKYIGGEGARIKLHKLGGSEWDKTKGRARGAVLELARELVALYARRQSAKGHAYGADTVWQSEFEDTFEYVETEDQVSAIEDVKRDMESDKVMDRLICGDVGYGKTEIALRAAFKAVMDGKQVAYLVPTTILAHQHYTTFTTRMKDFPVGVEMLSRFRSPKQQSESIKLLESGSSDIAIGTHRLLSKDIKFRNLGLVIVDEEQRFGVSHKEKLKTLKENVDVITLTATPIPRTLHMSLAGIRDMSILEEPPQERQPVQTYVMEYNQDFVREAIIREMGRGGQVYYLHNRVRNITEETNAVSRLAPEAAVACAHGQMSERELENIMLDFIEKKIDVLVCTTIIEAGLDIANVNTIIVQNADYMGLSQLYQLRGRVGRSNRLAYAYLMYNKQKVLNENAEKRLQTIREFTEFGSGFKIAMRDLEIRGAGNILGAEQHGHMDAVGYDMYCKLLSEAVSLLKGEEVAEERETSIELPVSAYLPADYIPNEEQKLETYKRISLLGGRQDYYDIQEEMEDRFGDLPEAAENLLKIAYLKARAGAVGVTGVSVRQGNVVVTFRNDATADPAKITKAVLESRGGILFTMAPNPYVTIKAGEGDIAGRLDELRELLESFA